MEDIKFLVQQYSFVWFMEDEYHSMENYGNARVVEGYCYGTNYGVSTNRSLRVSLQISVEYPYLTVMESHHGITKVAHGRSQIYMVDVR